MSRMKYPVKSTRGDSTSCLSKNLSQVLSDKDALAYFIQFMESCGATNLIKFWLDAETFKILNQNNVEERLTGCDARPSVTSNEMEQFSNFLCVTSGFEDSFVSPQSNVALVASQSIKDHSKYNNDSKSTLFKSGNSTDFLDNPAMQLTASSLRKKDAPLLDTKGLVSSNETPINYSNGSECLKDMTCGVTAHGDYVCHFNQNEHTGECYDTEINMQVTSTVAGASGTTCRTADLSAEAISVSVVANDNNTTCSSVMTYQMCESMQKIETASKIFNDSSVDSRPGIEELSSNQLDGSHSSYGTSSIELSTSSCENIHSSKKMQDTAFTSESVDTDNKKSSIPDAIVIFTKYLSPDCAHPIIVDERLRAETVRRICREDGSADPQCFSDCQTHVLEFMNKEYFLEFLQSQYYRKYEIDILTGSELQLVDILYNDTSLSYFTEFMEAENRMNVMQCFMDLDIFEKHLLSQGDGYDGIQAQEDAIVLYDKYFSLQATLSTIKFDDRVRLEVERNICLDGGPLPDCFRTPCMMVCAQMEKVDFARFRKSEQFNKYLSDLNKAIHTAHNVVTPIRRSQTGSDISSDKSVEGRLTSQASGSNTLLAMDTRGQHMKRAINQIAEINLRIDSALFDPDNLWHRPNAGRMKLGHINDLGQFISDFDPEPDHDKKMQVSFFNKRKEKDEKSTEEIALQAAQKIIDDIFSITQFNRLDLDKS